uniref:Cytochrome c biogenesis protein Ccs1 n=1 Tax=Aureoumbra lagunensis TaxID=44058 RepID=C6KJ01_9STRA|nr:ResB-like protein [Aureoumbra lagunensis]ACS36957.1 ResB-like protein [Aureoumbra lagunensis]
MKIRLNLVKYLANLPFAISLLLTIATFSIFGSIIEQDQSIDFYQTKYNEPFFGFIDSNFILQIGLDHIFKTWWFISLLILFGTSLMCCTFLQQLPALKSVRRVKFYQFDKMFKRLPINTRIGSKSNGKVINVLNAKNYHVFQSRNVYYGNKGILGRVSPIIVHFSMVLILIGTILASTSGFVAQELVPESEIFYIQNILNNNVNTFVPQVSGRVNNFWISYNDDKSIKQFYTDLSIIDANGKEVKRETIYVNHPLKYRGLTFYQTDWNILGLRVKYNDGLSYQVPVLKQPNNIWVSWIPNKLTDIENFNFQNGNILLDTVLTGTSFVYNNEGNLLGASELNEPFPLSENVQFVDLITETGIQIKADPGLPLIYFGFFLLIVSIITSYQSYSQVWVWPLGDGLNIAGTSNRSKFEFEFELLNLVLKM